MLITIFIKEKKHFLFLNFITGLINFSLFYIITNDIKITLVSVVFGFIFSILHFLSLCSSISTIFNRPMNKIKIYASLHYLFRYILLCIFIFISITNENINGFASIFMLLNVKIYFYIENILIKK